MYLCKLHLEELAPQDAQELLDGRNLVFGVKVWRESNSLARNSAHVHMLKRRLSRRVRYTFLSRYTVHTMRDCHSRQKEKDATEHA